MEVTTWMPWLPIRCNRTRSSNTQTHCELFHQTIHKHVTDKTGTLTEQHTTDKDTTSFNLIIVGDFNINWLENNDSERRNLFHIHDIVTMVGKGNGSYHGRHPVMAWLRTRCH